MSKITFRADDELVERLEELETSKSEVMRDALRGYLDGAERSGDDEDDADGDDTGAETDASDTIDELLESRVDELVTERVDAVLADRLGAVGRPDPAPPQDVNVNISLDGVSGDSSVNAEEERRQAESRARKTNEDVSSSGDRGRENACEKCGEALSSDDVYCSNCGEKATHRVFCECGDEVRSDWAFCPGCGRRTSAADVLERG